MDTLVSLGIISACGWSSTQFFLDRGPAGEALHQLIHGSGGGIYLEVAASVTTFLLAGRLYEARARRTAGGHARAGRRRGQGRCGWSRTAPSTRSWRAAAAGGPVRGAAGETIAADGEVLFGQTAVDRSMMTGESVPGEATEGDSVVGGTIALTCGWSSGRSRSAPTPSSLT